MKNTLNNGLGIVPDIDGLNIFSSDIFGVINPDLDPPNITGRIIESDKYRITEDGDFRVVE